METIRFFWVHIFYGSFDFLFWWFMLGVLEKPQMSTVTEFYGLKSSPYTLNYDCMEESQKSL